MGIKLRSLRFSNYLGVASEPIEIQFHPRCTVLCGPNNSGKTTVLTAVSLVAEAMRTPAYSMQSGYVDMSTPTGAPVTQEVLNFRSHAKECQFDAEVEIDRRLLGFPVDGDNGQPFGLSFGVKLWPALKNLVCLSINDQEVFRAKNPTEFLVPQNANYVAKDNRARAILELPMLLADRLVCFSSHRSVRAQLGSAQLDNLQQLAEGIGIVSWVSTAMNPNTRDGKAVERYKSLKEFESEFGDFAGFPSCTLSIGGDELNVHVDGHPVPISRLGAGIGECLVMMLVCKIARDWLPRIGRPPIEIILIEEPELHLHPRLQRILLSYLLKYAESNDVQLILSTHSATVLNAVYLTGASVYRTEYDGSKQQVLLNPVRATDRLLALLKDIGASPGDLLQADKVLWVEGPHDIPVFKAWLSKAPSFQKQNVAVLSLGGDDPASDD